MIPHRYGVYFFLGAGGALVKIGKAVNVRDRFGEVSRINAGAIEYLADIRGYTHVERRIHRQFGHLVDHSEWFRYEDEIREFVALARGNWNLGAEQFPDAVYIDERTRALVNHEVRVAPVPAAEAEAARANYWREYHKRMHIIRKQAAANAVETCRRLGRSPLPPWSFVARRRKIQLPSCTHKNCANCFDFAMQWYRDLVGGGQIDGPRQAAMPW